MGMGFQELIAVKTHPVIMKFMVPLSLLIVSMAKGQEDIDAASLNAILPAGYTKVCEDGETPRGEPRGKRQVGGDGPPPCWQIVDSDFDRTKCSSFEGTCSETKPYVGRGQDTMCIFFPNAGKWLKLGGTYGWCGADNCCDFHPRGQCNPPRPLATFFPAPAGTTDCEAIDNKDDLSVVGAELMKGEEGTARDICILNKDGAWVLEPVTLNECGGFGCCRFSFVNQPAE